MRRLAENEGQLRRQCVRSFGNKLTTPVDGDWSPQQPKADDDDNNSNAEADNKAAVPPKEDHDRKLLHEITAMTNKPLDVRSNYLDSVIVWRLEDSAAGVSEMFLFDVDTISICHFFQLGPADGGRAETLLEPVK